MLRRARTGPIAWMTAFTCSVLSPFPASAAEPQTPCERSMADAARRYDVPIAVFYAVGLQETGGKNGLQPYALNIDGRAGVQPTLDAGLAAFEAARRNGARLIDVGCMQINYRWHGDQFGSVRDMFDPARNVDYAAKFLRGLRAREGTWTLAVARYNAGPNNNPAQKVYVCGVIGKMVRSGFGSWTDNARRFCGAPATAGAPPPV